MLKYGLLLIILITSLPDTATATIYEYIEKDGGIYFTDTPIKGGAKKIKEGKVETPLPKSVTFQNNDEYIRLAESVARQYDLDPELVKKVIEIESGWNPYAVSSRGAIGMMQLMPETVKYLGVRNPYDPEENVTAGVRYLKYLIDRFGELKLALAAYNAGPSVVEKYGSIPPYEETRNYVKNIFYNNLYHKKNLRNRIYKVFLKNGIILFTNSPGYLEKI